MVSAIYNLQVIQGGAEVAFELNQLIDHAGWQKAFLQYCRLDRRAQGRGRQGHDQRGRGR